MRLVTTRSALFTIGELARRTGLAVKTIRFYSDQGLLPPAGRTEGGYRLYDAQALARLELVRTLRELGLGLAEISAALAHGASARELALRHAEALDEQIRQLRLRRAVLRALAKRDSELQEVSFMNRLASMSDAQRKQLLDEFWDEMMDGLDVDPQFYRWMRSARPELPDDPAPEQLEAWLEFAELVQDPGFRTAIRALSEQQARQRAAGEFEPLARAQREHWAQWTARAQAALTAGEAPSSAAGRALAAQIAAAAARAGQDPASPQLRAELADRLAAAGDPRAERYWQLLAIINGWPPIPTSLPAVQFMIRALRS